MTDLGPSEQEASQVPSHTVAVDTGATALITCAMVGLPEQPTEYLAPNLSVLRWPFSGTLLFDGTPLNPSDRLSSMDIAAGRLSYQHQDAANDEVMWSADRIVFAAVNELDATTSRLSLGIEISPPSRVSPDEFIDHLKLDVAR